MCPGAFPCLIWLAGGRPGVVRVTEKRAGAPQYSCRHAMAFTSRFLVPARVFTLVPPMCRTTRRKTRRSGLDDQPQAREVRGQGA